MPRNPEKTDDLVVQIQNLLDASKPNDAVALIHNCGISSADLSNIYGVALMRVGEAAKAVEVYRRLCVNESGFCLKPNLPTVFKANYATALLLTRNVSGCLATLREVAEKNHPYVTKLRAAIGRWRRTVGWWRRLTLDWWGVEPALPVELDFPPGEPVAERRLSPAA